MNSADQRRVGEHVALYERQQRQDRMFASAPPSNPTPSRMVIGPDGVIITDPDDHGSYARDFNQDFR